MATKKTEKKEEKLVELPLGKDAESQQKKYNCEWKPPTLFGKPTRQNIELAVQMVEQAGLPIQIFHVRACYKRPTSTQIPYRFNDYKEDNPEKFPPSDSKLVEIKNEEILALQLENQELKGVIIDLLEKLKEFGCTPEIQVPF